MAKLAPLAGHLPRWATSANLVERSVEPATPLQLTVLLRRSAAAQKAFEQLLADQQSPGSPRYHHWIAPGETGSLFGPTQSDVQTVVSWLQTQGFIVRSTAPSRMTIEISGSVETAARAFQTSFSLYRSGSTTLRAPNREPLVPEAVLPVVEFISDLAEHAPPRPTNFALTNTRPAYTDSTGVHLLAPADFATIYDLVPLLATNTGATVDGKQQHVAILDLSEVDPADIQLFAQSVGSSSYNFTTYSSYGPGPGYKGTRGEATGDLERVLGTAPGVAADLVVGPDESFAALYSTATYAVNVLQDPIITVSYGYCEESLIPGELDEWSDLWATAAANGTSVFVASGDSGAAGCEPQGDPPPATQFYSANGLCAQDATCVGGTEFNDSANSSLYWSSSNAASTMGSALSYIPEGVWNDPEENGQTIIYAGSGGASQYFSKPSWQTGPGVPADGARDTPDVSFTASPYHDAYFGCLRGECSGGGGTSLATPSMAAIAALLNTAAGTRQGNLNPLLYRLASSPAAANIFHDTTVASSGVANCTVSVPSLCNNSTPSLTALTGGLEGYVVTPGYDLATGWGSLDAANFIRAAIPVTTTLALTSNATQVSVSQSFTVTAALTPAADSVAAPTGTVQFSVNGAASGSAVALSSNSATTTLTLPTPGTYSLTAVYSGDSYYRGAASSSVQVTVTTTPPSFTLSPASASLSFASGAETGNSNTIGLTSTLGFAGNVSLSCSISGSTAAYPPSCAVDPQSVALSASGTATANVVIGSTFPQKAAALPLLPSALGAACPLLCGFGFVAMRRRAKWTAILGVALFGVLLSMGGCGSGPSKSAVSSVGLYTVTVTGSGLSNGALSASTASGTFAVVIH